MPVPNFPNWLGLQFYAQNAVADPQGAFLGSLAASNGVALLIGN